MGAMYTTPISKNRFSQDRFPIALKGLMDERRLSYRQLAYKTKLSAGYLNHLTKGTRPVPADPVIGVIAEALRVEPDFFLEFRLRQVADVLDGSPALADKLYGILLRHQPVPEDFADALRSTTGATGATAATGTTSERRGRRVLTQSTLRHREPRRPAAEAGGWPSGRLRARPPDCAGRRSGAAPGRRRPPAGPSKPGRPRKPPRGTADATGSPARRTR